MQCNEMGDIKSAIYFKGKKEKKYFIKIRAGN